jgi:hypothetical protein
MHDLLFSGVLCDSGGSFDDFVVDRNVEDSSDPIPSIPVAITRFIRIKRRIS